MRKTKVGLIPIDWEVRKIEDISKNVFAGATPSTRNSEFWDGDIPWMSSGEINKKFIWDTEKKITKEGFKSSSTKMVPKDSVLVALAGQGKTRGTVAMNKIELCTNQSLASIVPNDTVYSKFLYYNLDSRYDELRKMSTGDGGRGGLNLKIINNIYIGLPPLLEQKKVVNILSSWDKAIDLKVKLIEQKKEQKKGLMQKLLTGKVRLPGFKDKWENKQIKDIAGIYLGLTYTPKYVSEGVPFLSVKDLDGDKLNFDNVKYISKEEYEDSTSNAKPKKGDILFGRVGTLGNPVILNEDIEFCIFVSLGFLRMKNHNVSNYFVKFWMQSDLFTRQVEAKVAGSSQKNLNTGWLKEFEIKLPHINEQAAIVNILLEIDKEINLLERELSLLKQQKKGLMQLLLTGKVRVRV